MKSKQNTAVFTVNGQTIEGTMRSKNDTPDQIEIISESGDVELSFRQES